MNNILAAILNSLNIFRCGEGFSTILPSVLFALCISMVLHHFLLASGRSFTYRRLTREVLVQEMIFVWMLHFALRLWLYTVNFIDVSVQAYWLQMGQWFPKQDVSGAPGPDLHNIPMVVQFLLEPATVKIALCSAMAVLPLMLVNRTRTRRERHPLAQFMIWLGAHRWERSELGHAGYFMVRPVLQGSGTSSQASSSVFSRYSTGCIALPDSVDRLTYTPRAPGPRLPPARKLSATLRPTRSTI